MEKKLISALFKSFFPGWFLPGWFLPWIFLPNTIIIGKVPVWISEVDVHCARLVLGWVITFMRVNCLSISNYHAVLLSLYPVDWPTVVLQCFDTVDWVIWPVKTKNRPRYDLNVLNPTLLLLLLLLSLAIPPCRHSEYHESWEVNSVVH